MTNEVTGGKMLVAGTSILAALVGWVETVEAMLRIIATMVSIVAGVVVIWPQVKRLVRKRKKK